MLSKILTGCTRKLRLCQSTKYWAEKYIRTRWHQNQPNKNKAIISSPEAWLLILWEKNCEHVLGLTTWRRSRQQPRRNQAWFVGTESGLSILLPTEKLGKCQDKVFFYLLPGFVLCNNTKFSCYFRPSLCIEWQEFGLIVNKIVQQTITTVYRRDM